MSGDSHDQPHKKEEVDLLVVPDRKIPSGTLAATTALATTAADVPSENVAATAVDDKQQLIGQETEVSKVSLYFKCGLNGFIQYHGYF